MDQSIYFLDKSKKIESILINQFPNLEIKIDYLYKDALYIKSSIKTIKLKTDNEGKLIEVDLGNCNGITSIERDYLLAYMFTKILYGFNGDKLDINFSNVDDLTYEELCTLKEYYGYYNVYESCFTEVSKLLPRDKKSLAKKVLADAFRIPFNLLEKLR